MIECECGEDIDPRRWALGPEHRMCLKCGEANARLARKSWTVVQEYTTGNYQLVTASAAYVTLRQTNPKENRV